MPVRGDNARLREAIQRIQGLAAPDMRLALTQVLGATAVSLAQQQFLKQRDPYGRPWARLKAKYGRRVGGQPLMDTGRMRNAFSFAASPEGFVLRNNVQHMPFHQDGTSRIPMRRMVPTVAGDLGEWGGPFDRVFERFVDELARGVA